MTSIQTKRSQKWKRKMWKREKFSVKSELFSAEPWFIILLLHLWRSIFQSELGLGSEREYEAEGASPPQMVSETRCSDQNLLHLVKKIFVNMFQIFNYRPHSTQPWGNLRETSHFGIYHRLAQLSTSVGKSI